MRETPAESDVLEKDEGPGLFVAEDGGTFLCEDCFPEGLDLGDPEVEVWRQYSDGWLAPCVCRLCKLSIPVYVSVW